MTASPRFHIPFEHGAWWSFGATLAGALVVALIRGADPVAVAGAAIALLSGFVLQDWGQSLLAALLGRRSQALSQWQAPQGWALAALATAGLAVQVWRAAPESRGAWFLLWALAGLGMALGLLGRILQSARGRQSLAFTALLLSVPALPLGVLAFGFDARAAAFLAWPLFYYPAATLAAQSYIRGFPQGARWLGPAMAAVLGLAALGLHAWIPALLLLANAVLLLRSITRRWREHPEGLPPSGAIRAFGRVQAGFGVALTVAWAWIFAAI